MLDDIQKRMLRQLIVRSPAPEQLRPALAATYGPSAIEALPVNGTLGELADAVIGVLERHGFDPNFFVEWSRRIRQVWVELVAFAAGMGIPLGNDQAPATAEEPPRSSKSSAFWLILGIIGAIVILVVLAIGALLALGLALLRSRRK
jgi:hypothetical protein